VAKVVKVFDCNGRAHVYNSTLGTGYHSIPSTNGVCIVEKKLFRSPTVVDCYPNACGTARPRVEETTCRLCSLVNPTQRL
jgi:hypothetical protein